MKTSVSLATLDQRISRLGQYINEAQWRYQLVSTCCDVEDLEDDVIDDQSSFFSDDSDLDLDIGKCEGKVWDMSSTRLTFIIACTQPCVAGRFKEAPYSYL
jgi:hypothetical protein